MSSISSPDWKVILQEINQDIENSNEWAMQFEKYVDHNAHKRIRNKVNTLRRKITSSSGVIVWTDKKFNTGDRDCVSYGHCFQGYEGASGIQGRVGERARELIGEGAEEDTAHLEV